MPPVSTRNCTVNERPTHSCLPHLVAHSPVRNETVEAALGIDLRVGGGTWPIASLISHDAGFLHTDVYSEGVAWQQCGRLGNQEKCRAAVGSTIYILNAGLPILPGLSICSNSGPAINCADGPSTFLRNLAVKPSRRVIRTDCYPVQLKDSCCPIVKGRLDRA